MLKAGFLVFGRNEVRESGDLAAKFMSYYRYPKCVYK